MTTSSNCNSDQALRNLQSYPRLERFYKWKDQIACTVHEDFSEATFGPELGDRVRDFLTKTMPLMEYLSKFGV